MCFGKYLATASLAVVALRLEAQVPADSLRRRKLDTIVVTAAKIPQKHSQSAITVLFGDELRGQGISNIADALRDVPGAQIVQTGSEGSLTSLYLRGGERGFTRVLLDGIPLNEPGGDFDFSEIGLYDIERIEIVRGPASVLYGSDAVSGVIQIFTHTGQSRSHKALIRTGSLGSLTAATSIQGGDSSKRGSLSAERSHTNGSYAFNSASDRMSVTASAAGALGGTELRLISRSAQRRSEIPTDGTGAVVDRNSRSTGNRQLLAVSAERPIMQGTARLLLSTSRTSNVFDDRRDGDADTLGFYAFQSLANVQRSGLDASVDFDIMRAGRVLVGASLEEQSERSLNQSESEYGNVANDLVARRSTLSLYGQLLHERPTHAIVVSARVDDSDAFGRFITYRAGASLQTGWIHVRGAAGTGFREPTFFESFATGVTRGNRALRPERTWSVEAGVDVPVASRSMVTITAFDQRFHDLIEYTFQTPSPTSPNYYNVAGTYSKGIEADLRIRIAGGVSVAAMHAVLRTRVTAAGFDTTATGYYRVGESLLRRAHATSSVALRVERQQGSVVLRAHFTGVRDDIDYTTYERVGLPAHRIVDAAARLAVNSRLTLHVDGSNVLDRPYQAVRGFDSPGRAVRAGIEVAW
jgi:vitamin B12 transporter